LAALPMDAITTLQIASVWSGDQALGEGGFHAAAAVGE
jgi:hypothetical protein